MHNLSTCQVKIIHLQEVIKIYLMMTGGVVHQLSGITCSLLDVLTDLCNGDYDMVAAQLDTISILLTKTLYKSAIERMQGLDLDIPRHLPAASWDEFQKAAESSTSVFVHVSFLRSVLIELGNLTDSESDYEAVLQKLKELIDVLGS